MRNGKYRRGEILRELRFDAGGTIGGSCRHEMLKMWSGKQCRGEILYQLRFIAGDILPELWDGEFGGGEVLCQLWKPIRGSCGGAVVCAYTTCGGFAIRNAWLGLGDHWCTAGNPNYWRVDHKRDIALRRRFNGTGVADASTSCRIAGCFSRRVCGTWILP